MPTTGELNVDYKEYGSKYKDEQASPGYYSNYLTKYNVKTEDFGLLRVAVLPDLLSRKGKAISC